ncbi:MAG: endolytic transglycosylase MltG [Clostridia bacterium]|nr:endolytic transglycosylase MltG [Clostridia bacterium]
MKKIIIVLIILLVLVITAGVGGLIWYTNSLKAPSKSEEMHLVTIPEGKGISSIAELLENEGVIKSAIACKIYCKINNVTKLQAGNYEINAQTDTPTILAQIAGGSVVSNEVRITFIEGKNMKWYAKAISENTNNTEDDVFDLLKDEEYIDSLIEKYWFITDEIKNEDIYYPLEGYLLPDTYTFESKDVTVKEIFDVILGFTDKFLSKHKDEFKYTVHQTLTLASMAELEGKSTEDRSEIIGVFLNRINVGMSLGSDVTTYYAFGVDMAESNLTVKQINTYNPYNTRGPNMISKIPIGPICNMSKDAIEATLNPTETEALYFVADKNGKVYFTNSDEEHKEKIAELKKEGLWFTY